MNPVRDFRNAVAARLAEQVAALDLEDIVVERSNSLTEQLAENVQKASEGLVVTIGPGSGRNIDPRGGGLNMETDYEVTLWVMPIYFEGSFPEDNIFIPMMQALHNHPVLESQICFHECQVTGFRDRPDPDYLAMTFTLRRQLQF